jgi:transcriptional regulator with XRE-family HTH domain
MSNNDLAKKVKAVRLVLGISGRELARRCSVSQSYISRLENGLLEEIRPSYARKIEQGTGGLLTKEELVFGE